MGRQGADSGELDRLQDVFRRARFFLRHYSRFAETRSRDELVRQLGTLEAAMTDNRLDRARDAAAVICRTLLFGPGIACLLFAAERSVAGADPVLGGTIRRQAALLREQSLAGDPTQVVTGKLLRTGLDEALGRRECDWRSLGELLPEARFREDVRLRREGDLRAASSLESELPSSPLWSASRAPDSIIKSQHAVVRQSADWRQRLAERGLRKLFSHQEALFSKSGAVKSAIEALADLVFEPLDEEEESHQSYVADREPTMSGLSPYQRALFFNAVVLDSSFEKPPPRKTLEKRRDVPSGAFWRKSLHRSTKAAEGRGRGLADSLRLDGARLIVSVVAKWRPLLGAARSHTVWVVAFFRRCFAFISYRRDTGWEAAQLVRAILETHLIRVFLDVESSRVGEFAGTLEENIATADGVVVVLTRGSLASRRRGPDDYFHKEILLAKEIGKKIIPIAFRGFAFHRSMPERLRFLKDRQHVRWQPGKYRKAVKELVDFVSGKKVRPMNAERLRCSPFPVSPPGVFIAYEPERGEQVAWILYIECSRRDISAYLDLLDRTPGLAEELTFRAVEQYKYFALILNREQSLQSLGDKDSLFSRQVAHALRFKRECEIVPFVFEDLDVSRIPKELSRLTSLRRVEFTVEHFSEALEDLIDFFEP